MVLLALVVWLLPASWQERRVWPGPEAVLTEPPDRYQDVAEVQMRLGYQALMEERLDAAETFLGQAIVADVTAMDAWLRLAEAKAAKGLAEPARAILRMVADRTPDVLRWQWTQAMLSRELGMTDLGTASLNRLVAAGRSVNDALYLFETDHGNTAAVLDKLLPENREPYLRWLMHWRRPDDAAIVWQALPPERQDDPTLRLSFIDFLINNNQISLARDLWQPLADPSGITHPGFEEPLTQKGFDWRFSNRKGEWIIQQTGYPFHGGQKALEVLFTGQTNPNFSGLSQVVPLLPGRPYRLSYWWKAREITSDQGPFMDVTGKGCKGLYQKGPMIVDTEEWTQVSLEFDVPEGCDGVVVCLRRVPSRRFDNKLGGTLWLDDFSLQPVENK
jgi:hypothetical protein